MNSISHGQIIGLPSGNKTIIINDIRTLVKLNSVKLIECNKFVDLGCEGINLMGNAKIENLNLELMLYDDILVMNKEFIVRPTLCGDLHKWIHLVNPDSYITINDLKGLYPKNHIQYINSWIKPEIVRINVRYVEHVHELLLPFVQDLDIPQDVLIRRVNFYIDECGIAFPLNIEKVESYIRGNKSIKLFKDGVIVRQGLLKVKELSDRYELI